MSQINQIQEELRQIEGGRFQTLANQYLYRRYSLNNIIELGSQCGTDKTTTGVPDMYSVGENGTTSSRHTQPLIPTSAISC